MQDYSKINNQFIFYLSWFCKRWLVSKVCFQVFVWHFVRQYLAARIDHVNTHVQDQSARLGDASVT